MLSRVSSCLIRRIASPGGAAFGLLHFSWMLPYPCVSAHIAVLCPPMRLLDVHSYINRDARTVQSITSRRSCLSPSFRPITTSPSTPSIHSSFVHRLRPSILDCRTPHTYFLHPHIFLNKGYSTQKPSSFGIYFHHVLSLILKRIFFRQWSLIKRKPLYPHAGSDTNQFFRTFIIRGIVGQDGVEISPTRHQS